MTKAVFDNIKKNLIDLIRGSESSIHVAVAWLTNKELLGELTDKLDSGIQVSILLSDDEINKKVSYKTFKDKGGKVNILSTRGSKFLHEKFALFDHNCLATGSYNWTYYAELYNFESIIISEDSMLLKQYAIRFKLLSETSNLYKASILNKRNSAGIIKKENELENLELELEKQIRNALSESRKLNIKVNFDNVENLISKYGGVGASKRLVLTGIDNVQSGFLKLALINRLDLSFEHIMLQDKFKVLFDEKSLEGANKRLKSNH